MDGRGTGGGLEGRGEIGRDGAFGYEGPWLGGVSGRGTPFDDSGGGVGFILITYFQALSISQYDRTYEHVRGLRWVAFVYLILC